MVEFDSSTGYLAAGVHVMDLGTFRRAFAWNARRRFLFGGLQRALGQLAEAGCRAVIVDGSYVTSKEHPGDWDAAFDPIGVDSARLDEILIRHSDGRRAMNVKYLGDLFPWSAPAADPGGPVYRDFFQSDRDGRTKGVVELRLQVLQ